MRWAKIGRSEVHAMTRRRSRSGRKRAGAEPPRRQAAEDPIGAKLSRLPGALGEDQDERLRRLWRLREGGDALAQAVLEALLSEDSEPDAALELAELDSWWSLDDLLRAARRPASESEAGLDYLVAVAEGWGDQPSVLAFDRLRQTIRAAKTAGVGPALRQRAAARLAEVDPGFRPTLERTDAALAAYLADRRPEDLAEAVGAWHDILMSERRHAAAPSVQLSFFNDAGLIMRELAALRPEPVLLDRTVRCWGAALQWFADESA